MLKNHTEASTFHTVVAVQTQITFQEWLKQLGKESCGYHIDLLDKPGIKKIWSSPQSKDYTKEICEPPDAPDISKEEVDKYTIDVLKGFCLGKLPTFEPSYRNRQNVLAAKITCRLLKMDPDSVNIRIYDSWATGRDEEDALVKSLEKELEEDLIGRCLLGMHYETSLDAWEDLIPLNLSNLSAQRMQDAKIQLKADDTQPWTLQRRSLIIRRFNPNLQRLLKIYMTNKRELSACILRLLVPYLILIANQEDYKELCRLKVFDENILKWEDIDRIPILPMLMDSYILHSLHEISNAIKYRSDHLESKKTLWLYRFTIMVAILSLLTTITSFWSAYETRRQADAAWAIVPHI